MLPTVSADELWENAVKLFKEGVRCKLGESMLLAGSALGAYISNA